MTRLSERLLRQQRVALDVAPLRLALRQLRSALEKAPHPTKLYVESLAKRPTIAVAKLERGDDGAATIVVKPARELSLFLRQTARERKRDAA
jgi:hypothetical protein